MRVSSNRRGIFRGSPCLAVDPAKTDVILNWPSPTSVLQLQSFLDFANFYRRFVPEYSKVFSPFTWTTDHQVAFDSLKQRFVSPPVLGYPDLGRPFILETDARDFAIANWMVGYILSRITLESDNQLSSTIQCMTKNSSLLLLAYVNSVLCSRDQNTR
jgi:hypothetical protein